MALLFLYPCRYWPDFLACKSVTMTYRSSLSFLTLDWFLVKLRAFDLVNFSDQTVFPTFFLKACRYWPDFLACKSVTMTYRLCLSFVTLYQFLVKLRALDLVNLIDQTVFCTFFPKSLQILGWIFACKSIIMTYRSSGSFIAPHWFFVKLRVLHLVNFTERLFFIPLQILCWFLVCKSITSVLKSNAYKDRHISYILKDDLIPSFTSKRTLYLQEYMQPVGDLVLPCNTFRMLVSFSFRSLIFCVLMPIQICWNM